MHALFPNQGLVVYRMHSSGPWLSMLQSLYFDDDKEEYFYTWLEMFEIGSCNVQGSWQTKSVLNFLHV